MKTYKSLLAAAILGLSFSSCTSLLDVNNPNYFTDDEMAEFINGSEEADNEIEKDHWLHTLPLELVNCFNVTLLLYSLPAFLARANAMRHAA